MDVVEVLRRCEEKLLDGPVRKNAGIVASMLMDEFQEFGSSGRVYSKQQIIEALQLESPVHISVRDFRARLLSDQIALVTYRSIKAEGGGEAIESLRSSIWVLRDDRWKMLFHQGTKALSGEGQDIGVREQPQGKNEVKQ